MRALVVMVCLAGCSTMSLRAGGVMIGGKPAFQASIEVGPSFGKRRLYQLTNEFGVQAGNSPTRYVQAANLDVMMLDEEDGPIARFGPRLRGTFRDSDGDPGDASIGMRGAFYSGLFRDPKTRSAGLGVELAGGMQLGVQEPVFEAAIVMTGKWKID
jgi:hypothetical protein